MSSPNPPLLSRLGDLRGVTKAVRARQNGGCQGNSVFQTIRTAAHMTHRDCGSTHKTCTGSSQMGAQHWKGKVDLGPMPNQKLFAINTHGQGNNPFYSMTERLFHACRRLTLRSESAPIPSQAETTPDSTQSGPQTGSWAPFSSPTMM